MGTENAKSKTLGLCIREARNDLGWSQTNLAEAVGFASAQIVSSIETGQREVKAWELLAIAKALHVPVGNLLGTERPPTAEVQWRERPEAPNREIEARFIERCRRFALLEEWCGSREPKRLDPLNLRPTMSDAKLTRCNAIWNSVVGQPFLCSRPWKRITG
jgi:transcriptional regulator with XRE-family HTH domain